MADKDAIMLMYQKDSQNYHDTIYGKKEREWVFRAWVSGN